MPNLDKKTGLNLLAVFFLLLLIVVPRLMGLDRFITVDESTWVMIGANYYYALTHFQFANTIYNYHPGVTTMWIVLVAMLLDFPAYRGLGQGYLNEDNFPAFVAGHGHSPLEILATSRLIQVLVITVLMLVVYFLLRKLAGQLPAFAAVALVAVDPYFLGNSRLLNHEAMLSQFSLISVLALLVYLYGDQRWPFLLLSGVAAGLANLTKSSAIVLFPAVGLILLIRTWQDGWRAGLWPFARRLLAWLALAAATYVIVWPGMWVAPVKMLSDVYGNAFGYALTGVPEMYSDLSLPVAQTDRLADTLFYLAGVLWRTTPVLWAGLVLGVAALFDRRRPFPERLLGVVMLFLAVSFVALFGISSGRNAPHYILGAYVCCEVLSAGGLVWALALLARRFTGFQPAAMRWGIVLAAVFLQFAGLVGQFPYYYTYNNPFMAALFPGQNPNYGYGELLEQAALYLSAKPDAPALKVVSWYAHGAITYFFPGQAENIKLVDNIDDKTVQDIRRSDYLVVYYAQEKRRNMPANLLRALEPLPPERAIWFNGIEYVRIYKVSDLPANFYAALP